MANESTSVRKLKNESPVKHTSAGEMPDASALAEGERRFEADLPLLSDPDIQKKLAIFAGALLLGIGAGIYFLRK
jgi:hypothetical protein